jgi:hypothetical protein
MPGCRVIYLPPRPTYDHVLAEWIMERRERLGHDRAFYNCAEWRKLRARVLAEFHGESQWELGLSPARYVPATVVHHVMHVEDWPGWALSEWAVDECGEVIRNLMPLSHEAHDVAHGRFGRGQRHRNPPITEERW